MKTVYLIDHENVQWRGLYGIGEVSKGDRVVIFYSSVTSITILKDILKAYQERNIDLDYIGLKESNRNALDFMICTYAGHIASTEKVDKIAIISKDQQYSSIAAVLKKINPNSKVVFEDCIYNVFHMDKFDIVSSTATVVEDNESNLPQPTQYVDMSNAQKKKYVTKMLEDTAEIKEKYVPIVANIIVAHIDNEATFKKSLDTTFGKTENAQKQKAAAFLCYTRIRSISANPK